MAVSLLNFKCNLSYRSMTFKLDRNLFFETYPAGLFLVPRDPSLLHWCTCLQRAEHMLESFTSIIFFFWEGAEICCLLSAFWFGQCLCLSSLSTEHQHTGRKRMWLGHLNFWPCLSSFQFRSTGINDLGRLSAAGFPASGGTDCACW